MRHLRLWDLERRLWTFPGGQNFSLPDPVRLNRLATAFTVFILPSLLCFTTVLAGTTGRARQPFCCGERILLRFRAELRVSPAGRVEDKERLENCLQNTSLSRNGALFCRVRGTSPGVLSGVIGILVWVNKLLATRMKELATAIL